MKPPSENEAIQSVRKRLAGLLKCQLTDGPESVRVEPDEGVPAVIEARSHQFVVEYKATGGATAIKSAIDQLERFASRFSGKKIMLVVVPFMGEVGKSMLQRADISWLDLSGNAHIEAEGLFVHVEGKPNRFKQRGRPSSPFSPKASRVTRCLLLNHPNFISQSDVSELVGVSRPYVSQIVSRLETEKLLERNSKGHLRARDPDLMLEAWREHYDFEKHRIIKGHIPAKSGDHLVLKVGRLMREKGIRCVATGLGAAWILTRFAAFRIATFYVDDPFDSDSFENLGFSPGDRGANVWLVQPNDEGVFDGAATRRKVDLVHPLQIYLDLKAHPERSEEAASSLKDGGFLQWEGVRLFSWAWPSEAT